MQSSWKNCREVLTFTFYTSHTANSFFSLTYLFQLPIYFFLRIIAMRSNVISSRNGKRANF